MAVVVTNDGELMLLDKMIRQFSFGDRPAQDFNLRLYTSISSAPEISTPGNFTEANFTNYVPVVLNRANFNNSTTVSNKAFSDYNTQISWTCGAFGNSIAGYYITMDTTIPFSEIVVWVEEFSVPILLTNGDVLKITPSITLSTQ